jgi:hypothetical protein
VGPDSISALTGHLDFKRQHAIKLRIRVTSSAPDRAKELECGDETVNLQVRSDFLGMFRDIVTSLRPLGPPLAEKCGFSRADSETLTNGCGQQLATKLPSGLR